MDWNGLLHSANDIIVFILWLFYLIKSIVGVFTTPLYFAFKFIEGVFVSAFNSPVPAGITFDFSDKVIAIFQGLPYWNQLSMALGSCLCILALFFTFHQLTKL